MTVVRSVCKACWPSGRGREREPRVQDRSKWAEGGKSKDYEGDQLGGA